jgi:hypothetical protein
MSFAVVLSLPLLKDVVNELSLDDLTRPPIFCKKERSGQVSSGYPVRTI